jgi:hypothetical protein
MSKQLIRRLSFLMVVGVVALAGGGCGNKKQAAPISQFACVLHEGVYPNPDVVVLTNSTGMQLHEARFTMRLTGIQGETREFPIYLAVWDNGGQHRFVIDANNTVQNVQKVEIFGNCTMGPIGAAWTFNKGGRR